MVQIRKKKGFLRLLVCSKALGTFCDERVRINFIMVRDHALATEFFPEVCTLLAVLNRKIKNLKPGWPKWWA